MEWVSPLGKPVEGLAGGLDLIVMPPIGKSQELVEPSGKPGSGFRHVHLTRFEPSRLGEKAPPFTRTSTACEP